MGPFGNRSQEQEIARFERDRDPYGDQLLQLEKRGSQETDAARAAASRMRSCEEEFTAAAKRAMQWQDIDDHVIAVPVSPQTTRPPILDLQIAVDSRSSPTAARSANSRLASHASYLIPTSELTYGDERNVKPLPTVGVLQAD